MNDRARVESMGKTSALLVPLALIARGIAFLVPACIAYWFGKGAETDAFFYVLAMPTFVLVLFTTTLSTVITPFLAETLASRPQTAPSVLQGVATWGGVAGLCFGVVIALLIPFIAPRITAFEPATLALAAHYAWLLVPYAFLTAVGCALRAGCEVYGIFARTALAPVPRALAFLIAVWWLQPIVQGDAMAIALGIGEAVQLLWYGALLRTEGVRVRLRWRIDSAIRESARRVAPILAGETCVALNMVVDVGFAATLLGGSVSLIQYADRARVIPQTLLASSLLVVAYATWSHLWAGREERVFREAVDQALRWVAALAAPVLAGMFVGRELLIALLFERGAFDADLTPDVARLLAWYLPGIWPNLLGILLMRAHVIEGRLRLVMGFGILSAASNILLNVVLIRSFGLEGVALATTLNMFFIPGLFGLAYWSSWRTVFRWRAWISVFGLVAASVLVAWAVEVSGGPPTRWLDPRLWGAALACFSVLGAGFYFTNSRKKEWRL